MVIVVSIFKHLPEFSKCILFGLVTYIMLFFIPEGCTNMSARNVASFLIKDDGS